MRGRLIYVVGPSGAGKDSVLRKARIRLGGGNAAFAHRYITRPPESDGENHVALSEKEFWKRLRCGCFAMNWASHGLLYGIGREIDDWMSNGFTVVVNGSRAYFQEALLRYPELVPVLVTASPVVLAQRLSLRGREGEGEIVERLRRGSEYGIRHPRLVCIENNSALEQSVSAFCDVVEEELRNCIKPGNPVVGLLGG
ncbi:phosphonate metabolism protein/1,5-bisphosphokinase (PRPP-forming) PhnN [Oleidesulfovibrio sp.]|uniref:phosphonate metabolism protein/1,5-bisphosphokinase (PRPP-forming) PhnN n=1 Tax=Oleidesulfovibrio sp. TaxID=2909707 RepID=UPI003A89DE82